MDFSQLIQRRSFSPLHRQDRISHKSAHLFKLDNLNIYVELGCRFREEAGDLFIVDLKYKTALDGIYLGLLDGLIELYQGKALEAISRVSARELDHFLRDDPKVPAVSFYNAEFYDVLSLGSKLVKKIVGHEKKELLLHEEYEEEFSELSFTEQIELFEEFLAKRIYPLKSYQGIKFDLVDVNAGEIFIEIRGRALGENKAEFVQNLSVELDLLEENLQLEEIIYE